MMNHGISNLTPITTQWHSLRPPDYLEQSGTAAAQASGLPILSNLSKIMIPLILVLDTLDSFKNDIAQNQVTMAKIKTGHSVFHDQLKIIHSLHLKSMSI